MFNKILISIGINKEIIYTLSNSVIGAFGSVITSLLIINFFTINEQGFYYTFGSLIAVQVFFELGLNGIIVQYVAHEVSHLQFSNNGKLIGDVKYKSRVSSLLHFSIKWYIVFSILFFIILILTGILFFKKYGNNDGNVNWVTPWVILVMGSAINLLVSPITAFLQGIGKVKEVAKFQLLVQFLRLTIIWIGLFFGAKLIVLGLSNIIPAIFFFILIIYKFKKELIDIWKTEITEKISYINEIFPYQWKIAISWISGYFIMQLFNPILFATEGPAVAGQMGLTLSGLNGILSISLAWLTTKIPIFSGLIAKKNYFELDLLFNKTIKQAVFINLILVIIFICTIFILNHFGITLNSKKIGNRFLYNWPLILMSLPIIFNHIVAGWAIYLRCHKKEPYLLFSIIGGIACCLSTIILGKYFGLMGLSMGYFIIIILMFPWAFYIYQTKKIEWHQF